MPVSPVPHGGHPGDGCTDLVDGASYIGAYFAGISGMMIAAILLSTFAKDLLMKYLRKILPHMERLTGGLLVLAGLYVIYYQMVLF